MHGGLWPALRKDLEKLPYGREGKWLMVVRLWQGEGYGMAPGKDVGGWHSGEALEKDVDRILYVEWHGGGGFRNETRKRYSMALGSDVDDIGGTGEGGVDVVRQRRGR